MTFDVESIAKDIGELNKKVLESFDTIRAVKEIDVGTAPKKLVYQDDKMKLYHYTPSKKAVCKTPVILVYALVNKQYMLDLQPDRSIVRNLLDHGIDLYIMGICT